MPKLPSWHACSNTGPLIFTNGISPFQGFVQVLGSSIVNSYLKESSLIRVKRSITFRSGLVPWKVPVRVLGLKFIVSTTRVFPSQRPVESPSHGFTADGA